MGCCVSKLDEDSTTHHKQNPLEKDHKFSCVSKSPPRPEEETVKEVLSETPKPKPKPDSRPIHTPELEPEIRAHKNDDEEKPTKSKLIVSPKKPFLVQKLPSLDKKLPSLEKKLSSLEQNGLPIKETTTTMKYHHQHHHHPDPSTPEEEISEVSEMCSLSETISTTTLEDQQQQQQQWAVKDSATSGELRQRGFRSQGHNSNLLYNHCNYSGNHSNNQNVQLRNHGRSPVRRADPSPPRRRYPGPGQGQPGPRRDVVGENSARRSRSPATRSNVGRSPSAKRNGPSPGRVRMVHGPEEVRKGEEENNVNVRRNGNGNESENGNGNEWDGPKESLENPLVSLECFIFL